MKQLSAFLLIIFSVCSLYAEKLRIIEDANLRLDSNFDSKIMGVLEAGTIVEGEIDKDNEDWYLVTGEMGDSGCVHKSLVERIPETNDIENTTDTSDKQNNTIDGFFGLFILIVLAIFIHIKIASTKCPKCNKRFAKVVIDKELLDRKGFYKTVKRTDIRRNRKGEQIGTIERNEQVHMITNYYRIYCKCKYCGYEYDYETSETHEG